ncbi:nuclear transport factor 2 family protein [Rhodococcus artemisiae]|uniref:Nuclear transport factor 2 family protein n=1 Tax=Rhodococcus artemisiae TaxID=714159 RepID=A0ABU7LKG8_9NOCA|nr:nuclear transport factor 2 family protein [Rhodococcus artemisiae]MEE2062005.1 nuclear transport factor 2 family protein [Rhodococcus artemisiae]
MIDDRRLEELSAKQAIADLLLIYCRGIDRCDADLVKQAFWEDAYDNHGADAGPAWEFADRIVASKLARTEWTTHAVTNHLVEIDGDVAFSEAIVLTFQKQSGSEEINVFCGRYVDRVERRDDTWRIAYRQMIHDWSGSTVLEPWALSSVASGAFVQGGRRNHDFVTGPGREQLMNNELPRS